MIENVQVRPVYAAALRDELISYARRTRRRAWSPLRMWTTIGVTTGILAVGATAAVAAVLGLPGSTVETSLSTAVVSDGVGTGSVDLGSIPVGTGGVVVEFICIDPGEFVVAAGPTVTCTDVDAAAASRSTIRLPAAPSVSVDAVDDQRWRVAATFVSRDVLPWEKNDRGETFGVINEDGTPDLVAVLTVDGRPGYVRADDLTQVGPQRQITAYDVDGVTKVGVFSIGG